MLLTAEMHSTTCSTTGAIPLARLTTMQELHHHHPARKFNTAEAVLRPQETLAEMETILTNQTEAEATTDGMEMDRMVGTVMEEMEVDLEEMVVEETATVEIIVEEATAMAIMVVEDTEMKETGAEEAMEDMDLVDLEALVDLEDLAALDILLAGTTATMMVAMARDSLAAMEDNPLILQDPAMEERMDSSPHGSLARPSRLVSPRRKATW